MTSHDPITAIVDQLAAHAEQLTRLEARQDEHHAAVSGSWPSSPTRPPPSAAS